ncbi:MAG TPA: hypothetical protein VJB59_10735 [Bdellovibrionota bacterium]|nr:hypothetical protein [Bdellovibrionota bacterium]
MNREREFKKVATYVLKNLWEAAGIPIRDILDRGYRILEISEGGGVFVT